MCSSSCSDQPRRVVVSFGSFALGGAAAEGPRVQLTNTSVLISERCLKHKVPRQKALRTHYNFYPCGCPACSIVGSEDGYARVSAKKQYDIVEGHDIPNESSQTGRTRRITACDNYIDILRTLDIRDNKLADAYNRLAQLHSEDFLAASRIANHQHCGDCRADQTARGHMDRALRAHDEAYLIHLCCFGPDHPVILHDEQRRRQWAAQLLSVPPRANIT